MARVCVSDLWHAFTKEQSVCVRHVCVQQQRPSQLCGRASEVSALGGPHGLISVSDFVCSDLVSRPAGCACAHVCLCACMLGGCVRMCACVRVCMVAVRVSHACSHLLRVEIAGRELRLKIAQAHTINHLQRIDHIAERLGHLTAVLVTDHRVEVDLRKRQLVR